MMNKIGEIDSLDPDVYFKGLGEVYGTRYCGETFGSWFRSLAGHYNLHVSCIYQFYREFKELHGTEDTEKDNKEFFISLQQFFERIHEAEKEEVRSYYSLNHNTFDRLMGNPIFIVTIFLIDCILLYWIFYCR